MATADRSSLPLLQLDPIPRLLSRARSELAADFPPSGSFAIGRAPGRLDVMGGIADYTGSLVCEMPLACAAGVLTQPRQDGWLQVFSFTLLDEQRPFAARIAVDQLAKASLPQLRAEFSAPDRRWAGYLLGCLALLQHENLIDLARQAKGGLSLALLSDVPLGAGVSSSA
ncbi:MAG: hypothetical protein NZ561_12795, partial [Phycisphaerae bacterium]|nr:hypothetical protein [Phycisphaerae bacterium]MDW8262941.1 hypothetical protein [Phycisphaerales bacterium]